MHLVENAPFNKGKTKVYAGVAGNLVAFACKLKRDLQFYGYTDSGFEKTFTGTTIIIFRNKIQRKFLFGK